MTPSSEEVPLQPKRKRAKHTRSRLGCGVCRIRRIRCDLTRPYCDRCTKTGRKCDGYPPGGQRRPNTDTGEPGMPWLVARLQTDTLVGGLREKDLTPGPQAGRSLYYFQQNTAREFSGYFDSDLWGTVVLQVSRREPCVQQMVVALGMLHESFHNDLVGVDRSSLAKTLRCQAVREYSTGITLLNNHISSQGWASLEITLLCSILCVAFEWLRGDYAAAQTHLWSSISIMKQWRANNMTRLKGTSHSSPSGHLISTKLRSVCTSLVLQTRSMPTNLFLPWYELLESEKDLKSFESLGQAKKNLDTLLSDALPETFTPKATGKPDREKVEDFVRRLTQWHHNFKIYLSEGGHEEASSPAAIVMGLWYTTARILLTASLTKDEEDFDTYLPEFTNIVHKIEEVMASSSKRFSVDIGVVPILYYIALKCRHPKVRRQAITMLKTSPRREAVWDSLGASCVVQEVLEVEENGLGEVSSPSDVPGSVRVCSLRVITNIENRKIRIRTMQKGRGVWSKEKVLAW